MKLLQTSHILTISPNMQDQFTQMGLYAHPLMAAELVRNKFSAPIVLNMILACAAKLYGIGDRSTAIDEVRYFYKGDESRDTAPNKYIARFNWTLKDSDDEQVFEQAIHEYLTKYPDMLSCGTGYFIECVPFEE